MWLQFMPKPNVPDRYCLLSYLILVFKGESILRDMEQISQHIVLVSASTVIMVKGFLCPATMFVFEVVWFRKRRESRRDMESQV